MAEEYQEDDKAAELTFSMDWHPSDWNNNTLTDEQLQAIAASCEAENEKTLAAMSPEEMAELGPLAQADLFTKEIECKKHFASSNLIGEEMLVIYPELFRRASHS